MKLFADLIFPIIAIILFLGNSYYVLLVAQKREPVLFIWWIFFSLGIFFIMGIIRWYNEEGEKRRKGK